MATVLRPPLIARARPPDSRAALAWFGANMLVLATAVAPVPFHQTEWPNPQRRTVQQPDLPRNILLLTTPVVAPFHQVDWPNPLGRGSRPPDVVQGGIALQSAAPSISPFQSAASPNPPVRPLRQPDVIQNALALQSAPVASPFVPVLAPNPQARRIQPVEVASNRLPLITPPGPFTPVIWPDLPRRPVQPQQVQQNATALLSTLQPFRPITWPNPFRRPFRPWDVFPNTLVRTAVPAAPFKPVMWPTPSRRPVAQTEIRQSLALRGVPSVVRPGVGHLEIRGYAPTLIGLPREFDLIPVVNNLEQLRKQANAILTTLYGFLPAYGPALPAIDPDLDGRLFVLTTSQTLYQQQYGAWVAVDMVP